MEFQLPESGFEARGRAVVFGAAHGVGRQCARLFAARGMELVLADIDAPALRDVARELDCLGRYCDASSDSSLAIFAAELRTVFPGFDLLVNAAGAGYVRTLGMVKVSKALMPLMNRESGRAYILNFAPTIPEGEPEGLFANAATGEAFGRMSRAIATNAYDGIRVMTCRAPSAERLVDRLFGPTSRAA